MTAAGANLHAVVPERLNDIFAKTNFCFLFAPIYHPAAARVAPVRKELGIPTIFNLLGPLLNPAQIEARVIGVSEYSLGNLFAESLKLTGTRKAMVVCGFEGLDEISPAGPTHIWRINSSGETEYSDISPADFGLEPHSLDQVKSGTPEQNSETLNSLLSNQLSENHPVLDFVLANTAALLVVSEKASTWKEGVQMARESISNGQAKRALNGFIEATLDAGN